MRKPTPVMSVSAPELEADEVHVRHNRKQHFLAPPQAQGETAAEARRASPQDFLTLTPTAPNAPASAPAGMRDAVPVEEAVTAVLPATAPRPLPVKTVPVTAVLKKVPKPVAPAALVQEAVLIPAGPPLYDKRGRLMVPPAMKGTHEILVHQNVMADHDGLDRVQDDEDLQRMRDSRLLVAIPEVKGLQADERLPENRRFTRPWTAQFLASLARAHYARFHRALQVNSAVRTVEFQQRLMRTNGNAAPAEGDTASPHLTGQAVDLAKKGMSMAEVAWMRGYLAPLMRDGKVDVEEEFQQACFHISVYRSFMPAVTPKKLLLASHHAGASVVAMR